ncbi:NDR1/HIN1-like protein 1 [Rhodamnia argentea]|uniref:NDR1/HIN1-like protein 1 n=1 Tax=Rhodamnia argentea TaxID=178133 RepID=A0A8B8N8P5_9MYRT|nr:NDR1/HIN1-like protein 1 [Rhodamnia argentea]
MNDDEKPLPPSSYSPRNARRSALMAVTVLLLIAGVAALVVYLIYRPERPRFSVVGAAVYDLNATSPPVVSTTMQFTLLIRNPNRRVSIYYDHLSAFVSYRGQAITPPASLPPLFHESRSTVELSPVLGGAAVPAAAEVGNGLAVDEAYGVVGLRVMVIGRLRYKAGAIRTGHYGLYVRCDVLVGLKKGFEGQVPLLASPPCKVDV